MRYWDKCLETPNTLISAFKVNILNGKEWKTKKVDKSTVLQ